MDLHSWLLPLVIPSLVGAIVTAALAALQNLSLSHRLRRQLGEETELLHRLPDGLAHSELSEQVMQRSLLLVSAIKHPPVVLWDVTRTIGFIVALACSVLMLTIADTHVPESVLEDASKALDPEQADLLHAAQAEAWSAAQAAWLAAAAALVVLAFGLHGWHKRARERVELVEKWVGSAAAIDLARRLALLRTITVVGALIALYTSAVLPALLLLSVLAIPEGVVDVVGLVGILAIPVAARLVHRYSSLGRDVKRLLSAESDASTGTTVLPRTSQPRLSALQVMLAFAVGRLIAALGRRNSR